MIKKFTFQYTRRRKRGRTMKWLMKSELDVYPWSQLVNDGNTHWDGVRNYQARNFMRDSIKRGDLVLFYHSNCKPPHVAGVARVTKEGYPDHTSWDSKSKYFDSSFASFQIIRVLITVSSCSHSESLSSLTFSTNPRTFPSLENFISCRLCSRQTSLNFIRKTFPT